MEFPKNTIRGLRGALLIFLQKYGAIAVIIALLTLLSLWAGEDAIPSGCYGSGYTKVCP
tara:strand:+ start:779 stop:955 length:177 start_codon:yes stop_codon:yes gene_type:complete